MPREFLAYWRLETAESMFEQPDLLGHSASNQFKRVLAGDTVWLATVDAGKPILLGRIVVGKVTDAVGAAEVLGSDDLWDSEAHILAAGGTELTMGWLAMDHVASELRFVSKAGNDRLKIEDGLVNPQQFQSMRLLTAESAALLRRILGEAGPSLLNSPDEIAEEGPLIEGAVRQISVNAYERNPQARLRCIEHFGARCVVCRMSFEECYGEQVAGLIHVHHLRPLSECRGEYEVNPIEDLRPVCPNCHAVIHSRVPPYSIEQVREYLRRPAGN